MADDNRMTAEWFAALTPQIPPGVKGLLFGLTALVAEGGPSTRLYLCGLESFDADDPDGDWSTDITWWPDVRYAPAADLASFDPNQWKAAVGHAVVVVAEVAPPPNVPETVKGVAVGWDDGDLTIVWSR